MNYNIINSGSDGNAVIVNDVILLDCGVPFKKLQAFYKKLELVFISHRHTDHMNIATIKKLADLKPSLRFVVGDYLESELLNLGISKNRIDTCISNIEYDYRKFKIELFNLFHDVENRGIKIHMNNKKLIYATDTKSIDHIEAKNYDVYLIEANYEDEEILHNYAYNSEYENRVKNTHLSKMQATEWLLKNMNDTSIYEFMHQHKEKALAKRFIEIKPILEEVSKITNKTYELTDNDIKIALEDMLLRCQDESR